MRFRQNKLLILAVSLAIICIATLSIWAAAPVGNTNAKKGGELILHTSEFPKSFNYLIETTADAASVFSLVYDSLLELHPTTLEFQPLIAKSWTISPDKKVFTFTIDRRAKWDDGKPITAKDIKFTYDLIMNPKNLTSVERMTMGRFESPKIINKYTVEFTAKTIHYNNFVALAYFTPLPKHLFEGRDFNKSFNMSLPPGSGPYTLSEIKEGRYYVLKRRHNYWADQLPSHRGMYNFKLIKYKVMEQAVAFEAFKKGDFDIYDEITPKRWVTETNSVPFQKNWIVKQKIHNYAPRGFTGLAFNMRRPLFKDIRIRQAITYLLDRDYLIEKMMYNQVKPLRSYWPSLYGNGQGNEPYQYDPAKAKQLLNEAGFSHLDKEGYLINQKGERLEFNLLYEAESYEKYMTYFADTCKQAGVKVNLQLVSWATKVKKMDDYDFDTVLAAWTGTIFEDPEQLWHSKHISEPGASNITGFKNEEVDKLTDSLPPIFEASKRKQIIKQIDHLIYQDAPYVLMWERDSTWIFYKNIFGMPKTVFTKYSTSDVISYWWYDPVKVKRYQKAMKNNKALPKQPEEVYYDKIAEEK